MTDYDLGYTDGREEIREWLHKQINEYHSTSDPYQEGWLQGLKHILRTVWREEL